MKLSALSLCLRNSCIGLWVILATIVAAKTAAAADLPTVQDVQAKYSEALTLVSKLECHYEVLKDLTKPALKDAFQVYDIQYTSDGKRFALAATYGKLTDPVAVLNWHGFNGKSYSKWSELVQPDLSKPYWAPHGLISPEADQAKAHLPFSLEIALGKSYWGSKHELMGVFKDCPAPIVAAGKMGDTECVLVEFIAHPGPHTARQRDLVYHTRVWFDPSVGFLPRRIRSEYTLNNQNEYYDCQIESFREIGEIDGRKIYLPEEAIHKRSIVDYRLKLKKAEIPQNIPESTFEPKFPDGTRYTDLTKPGKPTTVVGPPELRVALEKRWIEAGERLKKERMGN